MKFERFLEMGKSSPQSSPPNRTGNHGQGARRTDTEWYVSETNKTSPTNLNQPYEGEADIRPANDKKAVGLIVDLVLRHPRYRGFQRHPRVGRKTRIGKYGMLH